jgi:hypothetical protein
MTWPLYQRVLPRANSVPPSATLMILLVVLVVGLPVIFAIFLLQHEGRNLYYELQKQVFSGHLNVLTLSASYRLSAKKCRVLCVN